MSHHSSQTTETEGNKTHAGLQGVVSKIDNAANLAGRSGKDVTLVAVSKTFGADEIRQVIAAGHHVFGENQVQEAKQKWPDLKREFPDIRLHLIGPLQTNKAKDAVALFDCIETIDRPKLARILARELAEQDRDLDLFIQVNTGEEAQKAGVMPQQADAFISQCRDEFALRICGLMCIPPANEEPSLHFALLKKIADRNGLGALSMGMSSDFDIAVEFGATHVRVGSAIFGERTYQMA